MRADGGAPSKARFEQDLSSLVGRKVGQVRYSDVYNSGAPLPWDYDEWHHAVMGVELLTDAGPFTVTWTDRFEPYGVEVFAEALRNHIGDDPEGPVCWDAHQSERWESLLGQPIVEVGLFWERLEVSPGVGPDGAEVSSPYSVEVPVGLRIDFPTGSVWFIAAVVQSPNVDDVFIPGDEIVVAFTAEKVRRMGFPDDKFTRT